MFTLERYLQLLYMYMQFVQTHIILLCMYMYAYIVYCICLYRHRSLLYMCTQLCLHMYCMHDIVYTLHTNVPPRGDLSGKEVGCNGSPV